MKKLNLAIIATIVATFFIGMAAFQPAKTEASNNVSSLASATPRKIKKHTSSVITFPESHADEYRTRTKIKAKHPNSKSSNWSTFPWSYGNERQNPRPGKHKN